MQKISRNDSYRKVLIKQEGYYPDCLYCETPFYVYDGEFDHLHARSAGGGNTKPNLLLVCKQCNRDRSNYPLTMFLKKNYRSIDDVYRKLKKLGKRVPDDLLTHLGYES